MLKKTIEIIILVVLLLQTIGCTKEDMTDCQRLRLHFSYTRNSQGVDLLATSVKDIRVYLFNETEILTDIIKINVQELKDGYMNVDIQPGRYTAVTWAGSGEDFTQGGYRIVDMVDFSEHVFLPIEIGRTTRDNFTLMLACNSLPAEIHGDVEPDVDSFDNLYHAIVENIIVVNDKIHTVSFSFIKNINTLNVTVTGLEYLPEYSLSQSFSTFDIATGSVPLSLFTLARTDIYNSNNAISIYSSLVRYQPQYKYLDATTMKADIRMTRLDMAYHTAEPVYLHIQNRVTGTDVVPPLNIIEAILKIEDAHGNRIYNLQQDIDRQDAYTIDISIASDLRITISIDGFVIEDIEPDIIMP